MPKMLVAANVQLYKVYQPQCSKTKNDKLLTGVYVHAHHVSTSHCTGLANRRCETFPVSHLPVTEQ